MQVLHTSPHPDDELIGAPATLLALRDAGHEIVNLACSLGRTADVSRRRAELEEACRRARFELVVAKRPLTDEAHAPRPEREAAQCRLASEIEELVRARPFELVVSPSPHDRHPGHELVARAVHAALATGAGPDRWWLWGLWGHLPFPTTIVQFDRERLREIQIALAAYTGELKRNDYRRLVAARSRAATSLVAELAFGFGAHELGGPYAEATTELVRSNGSWRLGVARELKSTDPFPSPTGPDMTWWLEEPSVTDRLRDASEADGVRNLSW